MVDIRRAIHELSRELGLARHALEQELSRALIHAARAHYPERDLVLEFSEWGFELSQRFIVRDRPSLPGELDRVRLQRLGFHHHDGEELVLPLITRASDIRDVPEEVLVSGPVMPFEEHVTRRVLTRWLSREGAARLRRTSTTQWAAAPAADPLASAAYQVDMVMEGQAIVSIGRRLQLQGSGDLAAFHGLSDFLDDWRIQNDGPPLTLNVLGSEDPLGRPLEIIIGRVVARQAVLDLPVGPLDTRAWDGVFERVDAALEALWPSLCARLGVTAPDDRDETGAAFLKHETAVWLAVEGCDHDARILTGRVVACPDRNETAAWDRIRYERHELQLRRGGMLEYPPLVAVEGALVAAADGGDDRNAPSTTAIDRGALSEGVYLLLTGTNDWEPPPRERDEDGTPLSIRPLLLTDENPHLGLEPAFRRPPTRCSARVRNVFLNNVPSERGVVALAGPRGPTGEITLETFDEFVHRCRPDLEADMRLRPPATRSEIEANVATALHGGPLSADLMKLWMWRDGQERPWPPLFLSSRFSFTGTEETGAALASITEMCASMPSIDPTGWVPIGRSAMGDVLFVERGGHGAVQAFLHDGEPEERVWPISDSLVRFLFEEFKARVQTHEAPCLLAERIEFDHDRLRRVSLQSLRRTDLETAPRGTVLLLRERTGPWSAFARVIPDNPWWVWARARSRDAALALLDDGIHRRPRNEWHVGDPDELRNVASTTSVWAGVMRIRRTAM